jgi:4-amino-4-deoxy-L-arabinose transferase-like glycosyltransferase
MRNFLQKLNEIAVRRELLILCILFLLGLTLRIGLIVLTDEPIDRDALEYYSIAENLIEHHSFSIDGIEPTARRSPGYPLFLAFCILIVGNNPNNLYFIQALLNILTILFVYLAMKRFAIKPQIRLLILFLFIFSTTFIYVNVFYAEIVTMFVISLFLFLSVLTFFDDKNIIRPILQGLLIGVLILLRPTFLYLPFFIFITALILRLFYQNYRIKDCVIITVTALLILLPWSIRNRLAFHQWIPLVSAGGSELWQANLEIEDRTAWYSVTDINKYEDQRAQSAQLQSRLRSEYIKQFNLSSSIELNKYLKQRTKEIILSHPFRFAVLCLNRFLIFWFSPPIGATTLKSISPILFWMILIIKYLMTILAIAGLRQLSKEHFRQFYLIILLVVYLTLLHSAVHAIQRYFLPLIPIAYFALAYSLNVFSEKYKILTAND